MQGRCPHAGVPSLHPVLHANENRYMYRAMENHAAIVAPPERILTAVSAQGKEADLRPWGSFTVLEEGRGYKIKRLEVKPNHRLSLQMHYHRSEHWIVVAGTAKVICGDQEVILSHNQSTYVPPCTPHRLENPGVIPLVLIEVQNGEYLGEDDIVRFHDDYARLAESIQP